MKLIQMSEIADSNCDLCGLPACDCIVQPMGYTINEVEQVQQDELNIFVCDLCVKMMTSGEWVLIYCFNCHDFKFIYKKNAKRKYDSDFNLIKKCPSCI